jgi:two-component system, NarL family, response regulator LiaR
LQSIKAALCYNASMSETPPEISIADEPLKETTILIVDDHPLVRQALVTLLGSQPDFRVVGEASDGEEAIQMVNQIHPDIVIMDITMPKLNGLAATRQINSRFPDINILALTVHSDSEHILGIFEAGASGYLTKSVFGNEVISAIRSVMAGDSVLSRQILKQILEINFQQISKPRELAPGFSLTSRELEIFKMAARGMSNKDIAQKLSLSLQTVKGYLVSIFSKLQVSSRTEAVMLALRTGILTLKDLE